MEPKPNKKMLDIDWHDLGYDHDWLVVDVEMLENSLPHEVLQVCDPNRLHTFVAAKTVPKMGVSFNPHERVERLARRGNDQTAAGFWMATIHLQNSKESSVPIPCGSCLEMAGRIFLAGDAAHQMPPFQLGYEFWDTDVLNLAWKLKLSPQWSRR